MAELGNAYSKLHISRFVLFHSVTSCDGILPIDHLYESVPLVDIDNACLYDSEIREE
jgi:hypothetical protein